MISSKLLIDVNNSSKEKVIEDIKNIPLSENIFTATTSIYCEYSFGILEPVNNEIILLGSYQNSTSGVAFGFYTDASPIYSSPELYTLIPYTSAPYGIQKSEIISRYLDYKNNDSLQTFFAWTDSDIREYKIDYTNYNYYVISTSGPALYSGSLTSVSPTTLPDGVYYDPSTKQEVVLCKNGQMYPIWSYSGNVAEGNLVKFPSTIDLISFVNSKNNFYTHKLFDIATLKQYQGIVFLGERFFFTKDINDRLKPKVFKVRFYWYKGLSIRISIIDAESNKIVAILDSDIPSGNFVPINIIRLLSFGNLYSLVLYISNDQFFIGEAKTLYIDNDYITIFKIGGFPQ